MGELTYGGEDKNLVGGESTRGIFPGGGNEQISAGGRSLAPSFPVGKPIYIYTIVPACVLIPFANHYPAIISVLRY